MQLAPSYSRLVEILKTASGQQVPAAMARWLTERGYSTSSQLLNNWSRRGVPDAACLHLGRILGCDPIWLFYGISNDASQRAAEPAPVSYLPASPDEELLVRAFRIAGANGKGAALMWAKTVIPDDGEDFPKRAAK